MERERQFNLVNKVSYSVMCLARDTLVVNLRFIDKAISKFQLVPYKGFFRTDGIHIFYNPIYVSRLTHRSVNLVTRSYLHMVLHCVYRHSFLNTAMMDHNVWDLACDMAVENTINDLNLDCCKGLYDDQQKRIIDEIKPQVGQITAEKIYRYYLDQKIDKIQIERLAAIFREDEHDDWYTPLENGKEFESASSGDQDKDKHEDSGEGDDDKDENDVSGSTTDPEQNKDKSDDSRQSGGNDEDEGNDSDGTGEEESEGEGESDSGRSNNKKGESGEGDSDEGNGQQSSEEQQAAEAIGSESTYETHPTRKEIEDMWKDISRQMQMDLETFSKKYGDQAGSLMQNLRSVNREKYDYEGFLKKFSQLGEIMKVDDDEFDYIFYTYGMNIYGKIPLVEPLEYKEVKKIKEFVIVIDTSESVRGDVVQAFIQKTYNIFKQEENFFTKMNIHIIQADTKVQEDKKITSQKEFDDYIRNMKLHGFGGTDFRAAFEYVDEMIKKHELNNLKGLIYFTDGYGPFPPQKPDYKAAFVFLNDDYESPEVPLWAFKLVLETDDIL